MTQLDLQSRHTVGSYTIDVRRSSQAGAKPPIILIHGIGVSSRYFLPLADVLNDDFAVHALDMPGYGKTPSLENPLAPAELADVVALYIAEAAISPAVIVGQSMGCQVASHIAAKYPGLCQKVVLIGPTVNNNERTLLMQSVRLGQDTFREPLSLNGIILKEYLRMGVGSYLKTARMMIDDHIENNLPRSSVPIMILRGGRDPIAPQKWINYLASTVSGSQTATIPGAPHNVHFTHPQEVVAACRDFLRS